MDHWLRGLPDYLSPGMSILFVGINPGIRSAEAGHHFAGPTNRFWKVLFEAKLIPFPLSHEEDWRLPEFGYGLTNIIPRPTAGVQGLNKQEFLHGRQALLNKIETYRPRFVALLGVSMARILLFPHKPGRAGLRSPESLLRVGRQSVSLAGVPVFVLPNPSGKNAHYSYQHLKELFAELREMTRQS